MNNESIKQIFKTYDVRGRVGSEITAEAVEAIGAAFADELAAGGSSAPVVVGYDMRPSSPEFAAAFTRGVNRRGVGVVDIGLCSTDQTYYASGAYDLPAVMFTASHNPADYNGIKFSRAGAQAMSYHTGLKSIAERAAAYLEAGQIPAASTLGEVSSKDTLGEYAAYLRKLSGVDRLSANEHLPNSCCQAPAEPSPSKRVKIVVDAGNGMAGLTVPAVMQAAAGLPPLTLEIIPLYFELDGTFPNHEANPLDPKNIVDLQKAVKQTGADMGIAFDGDADRCFVVDENAQAVTPSAVAGIVADRLLAKAGKNSVAVDFVPNPAGAPDTDFRPVLVHNLLVSRAFTQQVERAGFRAERTPVGHSLIKEIMNRTQAVFGCEHSAHYYFRDFWGADNGMLAALHLIAQRCESGVPMSELSAGYTPYFQSGEINSRVEDAAAAVAAVRAAFASAQEDDLDGLTLAEEAEEGFWWLNVRKSNTEPLLRLNVEAQNEALMQRVRDRALAAIRS